jgi:hypothetical protein
MRLLYLRHSGGPRHSGVGVPLHVTHLRGPTMSIPDRKTPPSGAERMRLHRKLHRRGTRCVRLQLHVSVVDYFVRKKTDRDELAKLLDRLEADDVLIVTRLDRLASSTRRVCSTSCR